MFNVFALFVGLANLSLKIIVVLGMALIVGLELVEGVLVGVLSCAWVALVVMSW